MDEAGGVKDLHNGGKRKRVDVELVRSHHLQGLRVANDILAAYGYGQTCGHTDHPGVVKPPKRRRVGIHGAQAGVDVLTSKTILELLHNSPRQLCLSSSSCFPRPYEVTLREDVAPCAEFRLGVEIDRFRTGRSASRMLALEFRTVLTS
jgi:hypothetical protein